MGSAQVIDPPCVGCDADGAEQAEAQVVPPRVVERLRTLFAPRHVDYILRILRAGELALLDDLADALIIARINNMSPQRLRRYDRFFPGDHRQQRLYYALQSRWLKAEQYLLGTRLGRTPTHAELCADFNKNGNGQRFRAFFAMKYLGRVRSA